MKKLLPVLCVAVVALSLGLGGCEDAYSPSLRYPVRHDPILMVPGGQLAPEQLEPDRPGQFPMLTLADLNKPHNPLHAERDKIESAEKMRDPTKVAAADRQKIEETLEKLFGTPAQPTVRGYDREAKKIIDLPKDVQATLKLDNATLEKGSYIYRIHCVHCHGVPGDGRGPTAQWINPHPRDFRASLFKFQSVDQIKTAGAPPRREDLLRTVEFGLEGSAMPAFTLLLPEEREAVVSYVIHLALRGKAELETIKGAFDLDKKTDKLNYREDEEIAGVADYLGIMQDINLKNWMKSQDPANAIQVAPYPFDNNNIDELKKSVERGQQMFLGVVPPGATEKQKQVFETSKCVSCHNDYGRQATFRWDDWGTLVRPNNLTNGVYRGGRRPIDFYYRIHSGINGSGMANFGGVLQPEAIWDLVNFVRTLPYPAMRKTLAVNIP